MDDIPIHKTTANCEPGLSSCSIVNQQLINIHGAYKRAVYRKKEEERSSTNSRHQVPDTHALLRHQSPDTPRDSNAPPRAPLYMFHHPQTKEAYNEGKIENFGEKKQTCMQNKRGDGDQKARGLYFYVYERLNASETLCGAP